MQIQFVLLLVLHLICTAVPQTILTVTTDPICPNRPVVFTCTVQNVISLRWLVDNNVQVTYGTDGSSTNTSMEGIEPFLNTIQPDGTEYDFNSNLTVSNASGREVVCDGGGPTTAESQTVEFSAPPIPPEYNCNLTGERVLRLEWINNDMNTGEEYRACSCIGGGCSCVPTRCGDLNNNVCVREFEADQVHNFTFTAVNCGSQESTASSLIVDARADPPPIKVSAWYNQSTGQLCSIAVTWDTVAPISIPVGCVEGIAQQYNVHCGDNFEIVGLLQSSICNGGVCQFESPASTGCTLSVDSVNVMGTRTTNQNIPGMTECDCSELVNESVGTCPDINGTLSIPNGMVTYVSVSISSEATYQCNDGFSLSGVRTRTCQGHGNWSGSQPACRKEMNIGPIVGGVVGGVVGLLSILVLILVLAYKCKRKYGYKHYSCQQTGGTDAPQHIDESMEYKKLKKAYATLIANLAERRIALNIAHEMLAKGFISKPIHDKATIFAPEVTEVDRMTKIIDAVLLKVKENSDKYYEFLRILEDSPEALSDIVEYIKNIEV